VLVVFAEPALHSDVSAKPDMWFTRSPLRFFPIHEPGGSYRFVGRISTDALAVTVACWREGFSVLIRTMPIWITSGSPQNVAVAFHSPVSELPAGTPTRKSILICNLCSQVRTPSSALHLHSPIRHSRKATLDRQLSGRNMSQSSWDVFERRK